MSAQRLNVAPVDRSDEMTRTASGISIVLLSFNSAVTDRSYHPLASAAQQ